MKENTDLRRLLINICLPAVILLYLVAGLFPEEASGLEKVRPLNKLTVEIVPHEIPIGGIAIARIKTSDSSRVSSLSFLGREIPVFPDQAPGSYSALIGAGMKAKPGTYQLTVCMEGHPDRNVVGSEVSIISREFPEERLTLPDKMVQFSPDVLKRVIADQKAVNETCSMITDEIYWKPPFVWPVKSKILSPYGFRRILNGRPRSPHSGIDLRAPEGTPVLASNSGRVVLIREGYLIGRTIILDHGGGLFTIYVHLSSYAVQHGKEVQRGQVIGYSGSTGRATGPHLHWGVSLLGNRLDPEALMSLLGP